MAFNKPWQQEDLNPCCLLLFSKSLLHEEEILKQVQLPPCHQQDLLDKWNGQTAASVGQPVNVNAIRKMELRITDTGFLTLYLLS